LEKVHIQYCVKILHGSYPASKLKEWTVSLLMWIFPSGNPDFGRKFEDVRRWWLETDDQWAVHREIGFDEHGEPIVAAPLGKNLGIYTDNEGGVPFPVDGTVDQAEFERVWREFTEKWKNRQG
jgi:hypothetical protein